MAYKINSKKLKKYRWPRRLFFLFVVFLVVSVAAVIGVRRTYYEQLKPVGKYATTETVTIKQGMSTNDIAKLLKDKNLIRSVWAFKLYVSSEEVRDELQAGTYDLDPAQSTQAIVSVLTKGKIATNLVTILPGQRLDQIKAHLIASGFSASSVAHALDPEVYKNNPALVDKPVGASLEGYLYPESFKKTADTDPSIVIEQSLAVMNQHLTPDLRKGFAAQGLSTYQGIVLASIVEQEVSKPNDRTQVAQVFLKRLANDMYLGSNITAFYGDILAGKTQSVTYDTPYNTYLHKGLPPTPVSNVSEVSLQAVAHPANTDWLYFVSGDDGTTYFSKTLQDHDALVAKYCHKLCPSQ